MGKFFGFILLLIIGSFAYFAFRPMGDIELYHTDKIVGKVEKIYNKSNDIYIKLKDQEEVYFIKNGLKKGIFIQNIKKALNEQVVTIYYVKNDFDHFDPLDPYDAKRYIAKIRTIKQVIYNEIK